MDFSPPGSSVRGIFPARVLEWGAIAFSRVHALALDPQHTAQYQEWHHHLLTSCVILVK